MQNKASRFLSEIKKIKSEILLTEIRRRTNIWIQRWLCCKHVSFPTHFIAAVIESGQNQTGGMWTCFEKTLMSSSKEADEQTSAGKPWPRPLSLGVHVANSHFSNTSASRGNSGCLQRNKPRQYNIHVSHWSFNYLYIIANNSALFVYCLFTFSNIFTIVTHNITTLFSDILQLLSNI